MDEELNPIWCPFCGSDEVSTDDSDVDGIFCQGCGFYWTFDGPGDYEAVRAETIARWNKRPVEDALRAENARLREEIKTEKTCPVCGHGVAYRQCACGWLGA